MTQLVEQPRHVCSLGGLQTALAIERAVPILHAGPGCGQKLWGAVGLSNGSQGSGYVGGHSVPSTNVGEREIIFGGEQKLRTTIENALKIIDADLFVVMSGCTSDLVGDDVGEVVRSFKQAGKPVVFAETGGFKGTNYWGHELIVDALIDQYLKDSSVEVEEGLINIWSVVPYQDPFWVGNLRQLEKLVAELGLKPNNIFGPGGGVKALSKVPSAQYNLLVSPWVGLKNVQHLKDKFGTEYLHYPALPIGPTETGKFLREVGRLAGVDPDKVEEVIRRHEEDYYFYIERSAEVILETRMLPRRFITVADSFYSLGISRFLVNDLGLIPETQFITDGVLPEHQENIREEFRKFEEGIEADVLFSSDGGWAQQEIRKLKLRGRPLILGSSWEKVLSDEINGYHLSVSMPVSDRLVLNRSYAGYEGALSLVEDIYSIIMGDFQ